MTPTKPLRTRTGVLTGIEDLPPEDVEILKSAQPFRFTEFVYTGNHREGRNSGNYEELESFWREAGLQIEEHDLDMLMWNYDKVPNGLLTIEHRGKRARFHVQARKGKSDQFGYTWVREWRLIEAAK